MNIRWKIVDVIPQSGSIVVLYFDADTGVQIGPLNIDLPIVNGSYPSLSEIETLANAYVPVHLFERAVALAAQPDMQPLIAEIGVEKQYVPITFVSDPPLPDTQQITPSTP